MSTGIPREVKLRDDSLSNNFIEDWKKIMEFVDQKTLYNNR
jgi:hypothetical protein